MFNPETTARRHAAFRRLLAREAGADPDGPTVAAAACRLFEHLARRLTPIIGDAGVTAVFGRSFFLLRRQLPWLPPAPADRSFTSVQAALQQQDPRAAIEAALIILTTASDLLASFVGERLTSNLLSDAWPDLLADDTTPEPGR